MEAPSPKHLIHGAVFLLANRLQAAGDRVMGDITSKQWFALLAVAQWPGVKAAQDNVRSARTKLEQAKSKADTLRARVETLDEALTAFAQGKDPHTRQALDMVANLLLRGQAKEAKELVAATDSDEDDRALARLHELREELEEARQEVESAKAPQVARG